MGDATMSAKKNDMRFSLSNMSLLPNAMAPWGVGLRYLLQVMEATGYDGVHLDPLWTLSEDAIWQILPYKRLLSIKPSWRENWYDSRKDWGRIKNGEWLDLLMDVALFGSRSRARYLNDVFVRNFPDAIQVDMKEGGVLQLSENHALSLSKWLEYPGGVELHSWHIRNLPDFISESGRLFDEETCLKFAQEVAHMQGLVRQIHVQIRDETELHRFFVGKPTFTRDFLEVMPSSIVRKVPILVTVPFRVLPRSFQGRVDIFKELRQCIKDCLSE